MNHRPIGLPPGTHTMSPLDFVERFCSGFPPREAFDGPFLHICEWASESGAVSVVVGGSFVSSKVEPSDIDILVIFRSAADLVFLPKSGELNGVALDIQFLADDQPAIVSSFLYLLSHHKNGDERGLVNISLTSTATTRDSPSAKPIEFDKVLHTYFGRRQLHVDRPKGVIIPIHGINTHAPWLSYFTLMTTSAGWSVAPFVYGREWLTTLACPWRREALVLAFRRWLNTVRTVHDGPVSIFAHSLGTYIFARYLSEQGDIEQRFAGVVFAGSIVTSKFDWKHFVDAGVVASVLNVSSRHDRWASLLKNGGRFPIKDALYGNAGAVGFTESLHQVRNQNVNLLGHSDMFEHDLIRQWLHFYEASLKQYSL